MNRARKRLEQRVTDALHNLAARAGASSALCRTVRAIATCLLDGKPQAVTGKHIRERALDRYELTVSEGMVWRALSLLERLHVVSWERAHVPRWRGLRFGEDRPPSYPRFRSWDDSRPRCAPRLIEPARELLTLLGKPGKSTSTTANAESSRERSVLRETLERSELPFSRELLGGSVG